MVLHCFSDQRKPPVESRISALKILLASMTLVKPASHRLRGKGLTNIIDTRIYTLSKIKLVSGLQKAGFQFGRNVQCPHRNEGLIGHYYVLPYEER